MAGDATLFMRRDAVEAAWKFVMPILDHWEAKHVRFLPEYQCRHLGPAGSRSPDRGGRQTLADIVMR